eukprot:2013585-Pyramimonas_sp.AAC.1
MRAAAIFSTARHYELGTIRIIANSAPQMHAQLKETAAEDFDSAAAVQLHETIIAKWGFWVASAAPTNGMNTNYN